jgi:peptide/nickel transport system substrate-binding protein
MRTMSAATVGFAAALSLTVPAVAQSPKAGGTLTYAVTGEPPSTDCHAITTYAAVHVLAPHYSLLLKIDQDAFPKLKPDVAESWKVSADGLAYTFKLRSGVVFHDGSKLTSRDVKATFDRIRKPPEGIVSIRKAAFEDITAVDAPDPATVVFKIKAPDSSFLDTLALPYNCLYSAAELEKDANYPAKKVMGSGPFVFVEHLKGSHWTGKRFDKYFEQGKPYLDGFKAVFIKAAAVPAALQGGQIDAEFRSITPGERDQIVSAMKDKVTVQESPWICKVEVLFNAQRKPFDNPKVRQALQMSIDRWGASAALSKVAILKPVGGPLRPGSEVALPPDELAKLPAFSRDIEKARAEAKKLLAEAGVAELKFKLVNRSTSQPFTPAGIYVIDQWRRIGVTVEHQQLDVSLQKKAIAAGDYDGAIEAFCADSDDPKPLLLQHLSKSRSPRNMTHNENAALDALFDKFKAAREPAQQKAILADMQRNIIGEGYDVPLLWYSRIVAHSSAMKGWKVTPSHFANQNLAGIWLDR